MRLHQSSELARSDSAVASHDVSLAVAYVFRLAHFPVRSHLHHDESRQKGMRSDEQLSGGQITIVCAVDATAVALIFLSFVHRLSFFHDFHW